MYIIPVIFEITEMYCYRRIFSTVLFNFSKTNFFFSSIHNALFIVVSINKFILIFFKSLSDNALKVGKSL